MDERVELLQLLVRQPVHSTEGGDGRHLLEAQQVPEVIGALVGQEQLLPEVRVVARIRDGLGRRGVTDGEDREDLLVEERAKRSLVLPLLLAALGGRQVALEAACRERVDRPSAEAQDRDGPDQDEDGETAGGHLVLEVVLEDEGAADSRDNEHGCQEALLRA